MFPFVPCEDELQRRCASNGAAVRTWQSKGKRVKGKEKKGGVYDAIKKNITYALSEKGCGGLERAGVELKIERKEQRQ